MFLMQQRWHVISFFHWPCEADTIQTRLPNGLCVDTFDGAAWIGLTPFLLKGMRPPLVPATLGLSFPEINLRTYVQGPKGPGIWFFSLDAARLSAVIGARSLYGLPYYWADMQVQITEHDVFYSSDRGGRARVSIRIKRGIRSPSPRRWRLF